MSADGSTCGSLGEDCISLLQVNFDTSHNIKVQNVTDIGSAIMSSVVVVVNDTATDTPLGGTSTEITNFVFIAILVVGFLVVGVVYIIEKSHPQIYTVLKYDRLTTNRPALWVLALLVLSYGLLIPGLTQVLFSFRVAMKILVAEVVVTSVDGNPQAITESTLSVISLLNSTGSLVGALLVSFYAIVVPALKLILLVSGEYLRGSPNPEEVKRARWCIGCVQSLSKWACPDMFAYILILYLLRHLSDKASFIHSPAKLDIGFTCFSCYCVLSTVSSLFIEAPKGHTQSISKSEDVPVAWRLVGRNGIFGVVLAMLAIFAILLGIGLTTPCMALEINEKALIEPAGPVPASMAPVLNGLHIADQMNSHVALLDCIRAMFGYATELGEANSIWAAIMLGVFVLGFTCLDMFLLALAAWQLSHKGPNHAFRAATVVSKMSMLDVSCMGVIIVCFAASMYKSMGVNFFLMQGIWTLIFAELVHYVAYWTVEAAVQFAEEEDDSIMQDSKSQGVNRGVVVGGGFMT